MAQDKQTIVDSIFANSGMFVQGAETDGNGNVIRYESDSVMVTLDTTRYNRLQQQAKYMVSNFYGDTYPSNILGNPTDSVVVANGQNNLLLQITGDLKIRVKAQN